MMFLSTLLVDVGDNPDRPRPGRLWLRNLYRVHQRLCMAFPSADKQKNDPLWLKPYRPDDFPEQRHQAGKSLKKEEAPVDLLRQVHAPRNAKSGFLFRVDPMPGGRVVILVLSAMKPNWNYAFGLTPGLVDSRTGNPIGNAGHLLAAPPSEPKPLRLMLETGVRFSFSLLANPVRRISPNSVDAHGRPFDKKWHGKHVPVPMNGESLRKWLEDRAEPLWAQRKRSPNEQPPGFRVIDVMAMQPGYVYINMTRDGGEGHRLRSIRYHGILEVTDPAAFEKTLAAGIGPAKGFGFGLLSLARV